MAREGLESWDMPAFYSPAAAARCGTQLCPGCPSLIAVSGSVETALQLLPRGLRSFRHVSGSLGGRSGQGSSSSGRHSVR